MKIIKDVDLIYEYNKYDVILVGTNINGILGNGFQYKIRQLVPEIHDLNIKSPYGDPRKMGTILYTKESKPTIVLMFINKDYFYQDEDRVDYEALHSCLKEVKEKFDGKKMASTIIGSSYFDGNGDKDNLLKIMDSYNFKDITIYDYEQKSFDTENKETYRALLKVKNSDYSEFNRLMKLRKEFYKNYNFFDTRPHDKVKGTLE